jgi:hypothetical protein
MGSVFVDFLFTLPEPFGGFAPLFRISMGDIGQLEEEARFSTRPGPALIALLAFAFKAIPQNR